MHSSTRDTSINFRRNHHSLRSLVMLFVVAATIVNGQEWNACRITPSERCITELAQSQLAKIDAHQDWITGAVELALAFDSAGHSKRAPNLLEVAASRAKRIKELEHRAFALTEIASALEAVGGGKKVPPLLAAAKLAANAVSDENKRWDAIGKIAVIQASIGDTEAAIAIANGMPQSTATLAAYKARTLHDIAPIQAKQSDLEAALVTLSSIDMGLTYYHAAARSDVAQIADEMARGNTAAQLLSEANKIARAQRDGYFIAGALRHIAAAYAARGNELEAQLYFTDALDAARKAGTPQQRARALSRVATRQSDFGYFEQAIKVLPEAIRIARNEPSEDLRYWAFYEISGAAAFAGDFDTAVALLEEIPSSFMFSGKSLKDVTRRDIAWGLARHRKTSEAVELVMTIDSSREQVQALSRIARILRDDGMNALPRYL